MFIRADEMADELSISKQYAYKIIREMNKDLSSKGFLTIPGRVSRKYFNEKIYGGESTVMRKEKERLTIKNSQYKVFKTEKF